LLRDAEKVLSFLVKMGADKDFVSYRELSRRSNIDAGPLLKAVNHLQAQAPSPVEVIEDPNPKPGKRKATLIRLTHHYAEGNEETM
jgi:hypothetical protein